MSVEQYIPNDKPSTSNSAQKQTTTLESPNKEIAKQAKEQVSQAQNNGALNSEPPTRIGFISLG